jgi:hypothetical protein
MKNRLDKVLWLILKKQLPIMGVMQHTLPLQALKVQISVQIVQPNQKEAKLGRVISLLSIP